MDLFFHKESKFFKRKIFEQHVLSLFRHFQVIYENQSHQGLKMSKKRWNMSLKTFSFKKIWKNVFKCKNESKSGRISSLPSSVYDIIIIISNFFLKIPISEIDSRSQQMPKIFAKDWQIFWIFHHGYLNSFDTQTNNLQRNRFKVTSFFSEVTFRNLDLCQDRIITRQKIWVPMCTG